MYVYTASNMGNINFQMIQSLFAIYLQTANRLNADYQKTPNEEFPKQSTRQYLYDFFDRISSANIFLLAV